MKGYLAEKRGIQSATTVRTACLTLVCSGIFLLAAYASDPASWNDPTWWSTRGAVLNQTITTNGGVVTTNYVANNNAVASQGQLKKFTAAAVQELNADLAYSGGAGPALSNLVYGWQQDYATNGYTTNAANPTRPYKASDLQAVNVGQVKYVGNLIWARLVAAGNNGAVPSWLTRNNNTDNSVAVLGQLKEVFKFNAAAMAGTSLGQAASPIISPNGGTFSSPQAVTLSCATPGAQITYTLDNGASSTVGLVPSGGQVMINSSATLQAYAIVPGYAYSLNVSASFSLPLVAIQPTFSPSGGTFSSPQRVILNSTTPSSTIYYTLDGSSPTTSSPHFLSSGGSVSVSASETIKAIASSPDLLTSSIATASYTLQADSGLIAPSNVHGVIGSLTGEIDLTWHNNSTDATYIQINESTDGVNWTTIATVTDPTVTSYAVLNLTVGQPYYFGVSAGN